MSATSLASGNSEYLPVELFAITKRILYHMDIMADPDIDTLFLDKLAAEGVLLEKCALEVCSVAGVARGLWLVLISENELTRERLDAVGGNNHIGLVIVAIR